MMRCRDMGRKEPELLGEVERPADAFATRSKRASRAKTLQKLFSMVFICYIRYLLDVVKLFRRFSGIANTHTDEYEPSWHRLDVAKYEDSYSGVSGTSTYQS